MKCPICGQQSRVMESRDYGDAIFRRRKCLACDQLFYTAEKEIPYEEGCEQIDKFHRERRR